MIFSKVPLTSALLAGTLLMPGYHALASTITISSRAHEIPTIASERISLSAVDRPLLNTGSQLLVPFSFTPPSFSFLLDETGYESVHFIMGTQFESRKFNVLTAGSYELSIADLIFPAPLLTLGASITSAQENLASMFEHGSTLVDLNSGTHYLNFFARTPGYNDLGLFGMSLRFHGTELSQVPIPGALWLLGSGLIAFGGIARKSQKSAAAPRRRTFERQPI